MDTKQEKLNPDLQCNICGKTFYHGDKHSCLPEMIKRIETLEAKVRGLETRESKWVL